MGWIWVSLDYATFGVEVRGGRVVDAAPIARWAVGRPERQVADYYRRRGAVFVRLPETPTAPPPEVGDGAVEDPGAT